MRGRVPFAALLLPTIPSALSSPLPLPLPSPQSTTPPLNHLTLASLPLDSPWFITLAVIVCATLAIGLLLTRSRRWRQHHQQEQREAMDEAVRAAEISETRFRTLWECCPMGIHTYELQNDGRLLFCGANPAADHILAVDNRQFVGQTLEQAFPAVQSTAIPQAYRSAATEGTRWHSEQVEYEHGAIRGTFEVYAFPTGPSRIAVMFAEITARRQAEIALRDSEDRFRQIAASIREVFYLLDWPDPQFAYVSPAFETIFGHSTDTLYAEPGLWSAAIHPEDRPRVQQSLIEQIPTGEWTAEYRIVRPDNSCRWVRNRAFAILNGSNKPVRLAGVVEDITAHHQSERAEQAFRRLAQSLVGASSLRDLGQFVAAACRELFHHDAFFLDLLDPQTGKRSSIYTEDTRPGSPAPEEVGGGSPPLAEEWIEPLRQGKPVILNRSQDQTEPLLDAWGFTQRRVASILLSPVVSEGRCIGIVSLQSYTPSLYENRDADLLQTLANHCASGIVRILAEEKLHQLNAELASKVHSRTLGLRRLVDLIEKPDVQVGQLRDEVRRLRGETEFLHRPNP